jgi:hypothetical protein
MQPGQPGRGGNSEGQGAGGKPAGGKPAGGTPSMPRVAAPQAVAVSGSQPAFELPVLPESSAAPGTMPAPNVPQTGRGPLQSRITTAQQSRPRERSVPLGPHATAGVPMAPRQPTLTQQIRSVQPPDVVRQAMSELGLLARELATLPDQLEAAGLARTHQKSYFEAAQAYLGLARQAWEAVAEERLEQMGAEPEYRQRAIGVARRITQLQSESRSAGENAEFQLPRRTGSLWRRRVELVQRGLRAWQDRLAPTPDPLEMGRGLFLLRGYVGLGVAGRLELTLLDLLTGATLTLLALLGLGVLLLLVAGLMAGSPALAPLALGGAAVGLSGLLALALGVRGPLPVGLLLGAAIFSSSRSTRNGRPGSPIVAGLLRSWWLLVGVLAPVAALVGLAVGGLYLGSSMPLPQPQGVGDGILLAGSVLTAAIALPAAAGLAGLLLLAVPAVLLALLRAVADLVGNPRWVTDARRYALLPLLRMLIFATGLLVAGVWWYAGNAGWQGTTLLAVDASPGISVTLTLRGLALLLALALPYVLLLELPYRLGIWRWRRDWREDLAKRRADVESHVRRLSVADPRSGTQDTSDENLRAMQYDMVLLQFYQGKIEEVKRTPSAPFPLTSDLFALVVLVVTAVVVDSEAVALASLLAR